MISVCIDISKEKSTVCVLKPYGEVVCSPFEMKQYRSQGLRSVKTDKKDSIAIFALHVHENRKRAVADTFIGLYNARH